jgi:hypothetical protein
MTEDEMFSDASIDRARIVWDLATAQERLAFYHFANSAYGTLKSEIWIKNKENVFDALAPPVASVVVAACWTFRCMLNRARVRIPK